MSSDEMVRRFVGKIIHTNEIAKCSVCGGKGRLESIGCEAHRCYCEECGLSTLYCDTKITAIMVWNSQYNRRQENDIT